MLDLLAIKPSVSIPVSTLARIAWKLLSPVIDFGSPVQRGRRGQESESWWHIPVGLRRKFGIGPGTLPNCRIFAEVYEGDQLKDTVPLVWGDVKLTSSFSELSAINVGHILLTPVLYRREDQDNPQRGYVTGQEFISYREETAIFFEPDRSKHKIRLLLKSGTRKVRSGSYIARIPDSGSNSQFTLEREYEGFGTTGV